jgi:hypothetical protein
MLPVYYMVICASICIMPVLFAGAIVDYQSRRFPKNLWDIPSKIAGFFTLMMYFMLYSNREFQMIGILLTISIVLAVSFYILAIRYGSGGDYRALIYIALLVPTMAVWTTILALVFGVIQVFIAHWRKTSVPWAISIFLAFVIVFVNNIITGF